ncbi:MAG: 2-C-methyl-D-erythritol 2,4-cyclodiphosphate synthase [Thiotrichales bacterium]|nr:2-C-methyl-D-erythritol 2,4-cyclodiphosphate synthase [Thiotrichales bacterium]
MRIGHGYDAHRFIENRPLILGGVRIDYEFGLEAHSDGDAVLHALCDAMLGAAALGDIGHCFPDTDKEFKDIDSRILLRNVAEHLQAKAYRVSNADITIIAQAPKLAPHVEEMKKNISADLGLDTDCINIKATTTEKMGFLGRKEGLAAHAVVLIGKNQH